jgi:hypothetical protein
MLTNFQLLSYTRNSDHRYNVFLEGRSFDRETYDNDVESNVFYAVTGSTDSAASATVSVRFVFKDGNTVRPYKLAYQVVLPNGDIIENLLLNV